jgi:teichuronic acid biosynthesis glycosyltransferase TuaG
MLVSIVMPTYNCADYIAQSVDSVLAQTRKDWELWIMDDCSTDNTRAVLEPYLAQHPNIHYERLPRNGGPAAARTLGMRRAEGKYVAFLDSDDLWLPDKLEKQIAYMEKNDAPFCCTGYEQMDEAGNRLHLCRMPPLRTDYNKMLRLSNPIGNLTVIYDQSRLGKYEVPPIRKRNDFALWLRILHDTPACWGMQEVLAVYRIRRNSVSSNKLRLAKYHWQLYRGLEHLPLWKAVWAMGCWAGAKGAGAGARHRRAGRLAPRRQA